MAFFEMDPPKTKAPETPREKPVLFADDRTDAERFDPRLHRGILDPSRIPGWSEQVQANDIARADALEFRKANNGVTQEDYYQRLGATPAPLEIDLAWIPVSAAGGGDLPSSQVRQLDKYRHQEGFRIVEWTPDANGKPSIPVLDRYGYGYPPNGRFAEDGTVRRGSDTALYWRSGEVARMWERAKIEEQEALAGKTPDGYEAGAYSAEAFVEPDKHETLTVKH